MLCWENSVRRFKCKWQILFALSKYSHYPGDIFCHVNPGVNYEISLIKRVKGVQRVT